MMVELDNNLKVAIGLSSRKSSFYFPFPPTNLLTYRHARVAPINSAVLLAMANSHQP